MNILSDKFTQVREAITSGDNDKALSLLLWIHDHADPLDPSSEMFRRAYGFLTLAVLAKQYEPARHALKKLIVEKEQALITNPEDKVAAADLRSLQGAASTMEVAI